jgi:hypothetical protein
LYNSVGILKGNTVEKVVYLLGAGFSAMLGLPLMSNFLEKSKDLYFSNPRKYAHFLEIFDTIKELSVAKNYYDTDLFNIEEILSILEMRELLGSEAPKRAFLKYLIDVINYYTPAIERGQLSSKWEQTFLGDRPWTLCGYFVGSLFGLQFEQRNNRDVYGGLPHRSTTYSVVTLNYDLCLETICGFISQNYMLGKPIAFLRPSADKVDSCPVLAKLHGSVDTGDIVPPTWNKGLGHPNLTLAWRTAHALLAEANHIRILGYSLPISDSYLKYLLRSSSVSSRHLKSIDVLCFDPDESVRFRYRHFVNFNKLRFRHAKTEDYLGALFFQTADRFTGTVDVLVMNQLEIAHNKFFSD